MLDAPLLTVAPEETWQPRNKNPRCVWCDKPFSGVLRSNHHHCRACGAIVCGKCSRRTATLRVPSSRHVVMKQRICDKCATHCDRLSIRGAAPAEPANERLAGSPTNPRAVDPAATGPLAAPRFCSWPDFYARAGDAERVKGDVALLKPACSDLAPCLGRDGLCVLRGTVTEATADRPAVAVYIQLPQDYPKGAPRFFVNIPPAGWVITHPRVAVAYGVVSGVAWVAEKTKLDSPFADVYAMLQTYPFTKPDVVTGTSLAVAPPAAGAPPAAAGAPKPVAGANSGLPWPLLKAIGLGCGVIVVVMVFLGLWWLISSLFLAAWWLVSSVVQGAWWLVSLLFDGASWVASAVLGA